MVRLRLRFILALVVLLPVPSAALAQGDQAQRLQNAMNNVQQEMMECAAYYITVGTCIGKQDAKTAEGLQKIGGDFIERGGMLAKEIGMTEDAVASRFKMAHQDQLNLIKKDCVNISSLMSRYQDRCELIWRDFKAVVNEYMK